MQPALRHLGGGEDTMPRLGRVIERLHRVLAGEDPRRVVQTRRALEYVDGGIVEYNVTRATVLSFGQEQRSLFQVQMLMTALQDFLPAQAGQNQGRNRAGRHRVQDRKSTRLNSSH